MRMFSIAAFLFLYTFASAQTTIPVRRLPAGATPSAPASPPAAPTPVASIKPATKSAPARSIPVPSTGTNAQQDRAIEAVIRAKLAKSKVGKDGFTVRVQGGVAFWDGQTNIVQHKGAATRMAKTAGARQVVNNIKISDAARQQATANLAQGRRRSQVKREDPRSE